jgi:Flp pilus assembly protein TadD
MAILDGIPTDANALRLIVANTGNLLAALLDAGDPSPRLKSILDAMAEGHSLASCLDITPEEREALLLRGLQQLQVGDHAGAQTTLHTLYHLEPADARVLYALGATYQAMQDHATAARMYLMFIALDAQNPEGFLRLGECFLAGDEFAEAQASFEVAKVEAGRNTPRPDLAAYADRMIGLAQSRIAA